MIDKNNVLVFQCIMELIKCDLKSAIKFSEHNQTCYNLAMVVAQAKDEEAKSEKQALIDKACEWIEQHLYDEEYLTRDNEGTWVDTYLFIEEFKQAMKGDKK